MSPDFIPGDETVEKMQVGAANCATRPSDYCIPPILNFGIRHGVATNVLLAVVTERLHVTYLPGDVFREASSLSNDRFSQSFPPASLSFASVETAPHIGAIGRAERT